MVGRGADDFEGVEETGVEGTRVCCSRKRVVEGGVTRRGLRSGEGESGVTGITVRRIRLGLEGVAGVARNDESLSGVLSRAPGVDVVVGPRIGEESRVRLVGMMMVL